MGLYNENWLECLDLGSFTIENGFNPKKIALKVVKAAFNQKSLKCHPDKVASTEDDQTKEFYAE
jgi:hypothetical protein